jgi:Secretion system C-terminal sorting domain/CARDB
MKNVVKLLLVAAVVFASSDLFAQYTSTATNIPFITGPFADVSPQCSTGLKYDDGTWENGYGWNPGFGTGKFAIKFTPTSYPYTVNQFCIAMTRNTGPTTWTFDIEVWDATGSGGGPGALVVSIPSQSATSLPTWPSVSWYDFTGITTIPTLNSGSYYIGISWTPVGGQFIGADESTTTPLHPGYGYIQNAWATIQSYGGAFANYRCMGIRVDGSGQVLAHDYAVGPFLGLQTTYTMGVGTNIKARVRNVGSSNETNVPVKFFVGASQVGTANLSLNAGATDSVTFPWTPTTGGNQTLRVFSELSTDLNRANDTVTATVLVLAGTPTPCCALTACRNGLNIPIMDNATSWDSVQVTIPGWGFGIYDVNAKIDTVVHTWDADLDFTLIHGGTSVIIINRVGSSGDNFIGTNLNDSATIPIASGSPPFTGTYIPSNPLTVFNGLANNPNGYWTLRIHDNAAGDTGVLKAWCVIITYYTFVGGIQTISVPNYYALGQNYPNPFNPSTKIQYAIPKAGDVQLTVYDILGRQVATLVNEFKNPGVYTVDFNASALSSGVYFYKIKSGSYTDTKKMLLVK